MKKILIFIFLGAAIGAGIFLWFTSTRAEIGFLNIFHGNASIVRNESSIAGKTGTGVRPADLIRAAQDSRVSLLFKDGSGVRFEENSEVEVTRLAYPGSGIDARLKLKSGRAWSFVEPGSGSTNFNVETPSVVATVSGTGFNVDYREGINTIYVYRGSVQVGLLTNPSQRKPVTAGQAFVMNDATLQDDWDRGPQAVEANYVDDWIVFNQGEDRKLKSYSQDPAPVSETETEPAPEQTETPPSADNLTPEATQEPVTAPEQATGTPQPASPATTTPPASPPPAVKITRLSLASTSETVRRSETIALRVTAEYSDGSQATVTSQVTWTQNPELGSIASNGYYRGILSGKTTITAALQGATSNPIVITVQETAPRLSGLSVTCAKQAPSSTTYYQLPGAQCRTSAHFSDDSTQDITASTQWSATGSAGGTINSSGYYTPRSQGSATITGTYQNESDSVTINIP